MDVSHPAQYSEELWPSIVKYTQWATRILDPMAGVGNIFALYEYSNLPAITEIQAVEIEPEWAAFDARITVGSVLSLPWPDNYFDCVVVSPPYGNRMADKLGAGKWAYTRHSYATGLKRELSPGNSGSLQWGEKYREFHRMAWAECYRVLENGGRFVLNCKDHYRGKEVQNVTQWHVDTLVGLGMSVSGWDRIEVRGLRRGRNYDARVAYESVVALDVVK